LQTVQLAFSDSAVFMADSPIGVESSVSLKKVTDTLSASEVPLRDKAVVAQDCAAFAEVMGRPLRFLTLSDALQTAEFAGVGRTL
jgi:hypothetical protein